MERRVLTEQEACQDILNQYLSLGEKFQNFPTVTLRLNSHTPDGEVIQAESVGASTAYQCYAGGVARMVNRDDKRSLNIARDTLNAGHHTTRMHTHYTWKIVGATRSVTHDVFHATPFYNSEQQSQRYVEAREGFFLVPNELTSEQTNIYKEAADFANGSYFRLLGDLKPLVEERVRAMNPEGGWKVEGTRYRLGGKIDKLSQEIARYVLPLAQHTTYDHTLNELQLLRLFQASNMEGFTNEAKYLIASMIGEVSKVDPSILRELRTPADIDESENKVTDKIQIDKLLDGKMSALLQSPENVDRELLGRMANSSLLANVFDVGMFDPQVSRMREFNFAFATKLSHAGDSQRQRHRRTAAGVMPIGQIYDGEADFITPLVIKENLQINRKYEEMVVNMFENVKKALNAGIPKEFALLLLPNAISVRTIESGDLFDWIHRWKQRLCYLAQEEIFFASVNQVEDVLKKIPELTPALQAPCGIRKMHGVKPRCPEGERWCGKPVFNWEIGEYSENRLI
ncbi:FAD-dependent thymidylate synthase [Candidatus Microgenomates bacterium]|nr:FAD-dependent thymidylate synthase [Candidatus Microgenomates bacterium]